MSGPHANSRAVVVTVLLMAAATAVYYLIPVPTLGHGAWTVLFFAGAGVLGVLILAAMRRLLRAGEDAGIRGLVLLLTLTVLFFSWADASVAKLPGEFADLHGRTDALYFNISTLATVGFGDIHPAGQLARAAVTLQIVFNLVFLGAAVSMISSTFRRRAQGQRARPGHGDEQRPG
jgi:voltage-gated potassium channel